jgi:hypothetical protein
MDCHYLINFASFVRTRGSENNLLCLSFKYLDIFRESIRNYKNCKKITFTPKTAMYRVTDEAPNLEPKV